MFGKLYLWGDNDNDILGLSLGKDSSIPQLNVHLPKIKQVCCGFKYTLALTENGEVYSWGWGKHGLLGLNSEKLTNTPQIITFQPLNPLDSTPKIKSIYSGGNHSIAIDELGYIYSWGEGRDNKTGFSTCNDVLVPTILENFKDFIPYHITTASFGTYLITGKFHLNITKIIIFIKYIFTYI